MQKVVIVGGGFCGVHAAKRLGGFDVTLIDPKDSFEYTPSLIEVLVRDGYEGKIIVPYSGILRKARFVKGVVTSISRSDVICGKRKFPYDYLVVCSGAENIRPPGRAFLLKWVPDAVALRDCPETDFVVCGGGQVGVEVAAKLASQGKKVTLVHATSRLIERAPERASFLARRRLEKLGARILFDEQVLDIKGREVITAHKRFRASAIVWCVGVSPGLSFLSKTGLASRAGIKVNRFMQSDWPNVFAGGDAADSGVEKTAQNACNQGVLIADNIRRLSRGLTLKTYKAEHTPMLIELGGYGLFVWKGVAVGSPLFTLLKKFVELRELFVVRHL